MWKQIFEEGKTIKMEGELSVTFLMQGSHLY